MYVDAEFKVIVVDMDLVSFPPCRLSMFLSLNEVGNALSHIPDRVRAIQSNPDFSN